MKEIISNIKSRDKLSEIVGILEKKVKIHNLKKSIFLFCVLCLKWLKLLKRGEKWCRSNSL